MPHVNQDYLFMVSAQLFTESDPTLSFTDLEICHLLIHQWKSRGYLSRPTKLLEVFESLVDSNEGGRLCLASLALAVRMSQEKNRTGRNGDSHGIFVSLLKFLQRLGRSRELVDSLKALSKVRKLPPRLPEEIARASYDHVLALMMHDVYVSCLRGPGGPEWSPETWKKYADQIIMDPAINPAKIWAALEIEMHDSRRKVGASNQRLKWSLVSRKAAVVESLAQRFADAAHLRPRVALRHVSQCVSYLEAHKRALTPDVVKALYRVVTADLAEGRPGRTERLRWLLRVVKRYYGYDVMVKCGLTLSRWRAETRRVLQTKGSETP
jgi:hypothetical protein